ncbi:hypothetical protein [Roseinatronobacter monicus]|uniref:Uncharacterized protein n=1 Tax=Roseinatronobacter monicus TaxID=393481 RepID=A0A543KIN9_9RHOB|nr:hypothetical protein [Roseinatronobacter monicus]TQM90393.1 hypothetical protein BD293_3772 [Roseinatronobacter monicus]TQM91478.1 hypothetical protein BD293_0029 [Roseinatronobacter monicus]TQM94917.1 hypothetical protein BD293_3609 [Roseinatronobacter monicus]
MSEFADIARAWNQYNQRRTWDGVNYGLIYTCNCGWVDLGHLNPFSTRPEIGAANLWRAMNAQGPAVMRNACDPTLGDRVMYGVAGSILRARLARCADDPYLRFADGSTGFRVRYRQDHAGYPGRPGREGIFLIKHGLTQTRARAVALSIFMDVSHRFERFQSSIPPRWMTDSGYSQEDLVSNLIGFYIGLGILSKSEAIAACHPVGQATAEDIWRRQGAVGSHKNYSFKPQLQATAVDDTTALMCRDDCAGQARRLPAVFQTITPAPEGVDFLRLSAGSAIQF